MLEPSFDLLSFRLFDIGVIVGRERKDSRNIRRAVQPTSKEAEVLVDNFNIDWRKRIH